MTELELLIESREAPEWYQDESFTMVKNGYLVGKETPRQMYMRVANSAAKYLKMPEMSAIIFEAIWKGWLCPASPVISNSGTKRGLPISCYVLHVEDSIKSIMKSASELGMLTKSGGGVGLIMSDLRPSGSLIEDNGQSPGVVPFSHLYNVIGRTISQGSTRRGAISLNLHIRHGDVREFLRIRRAEGDVNRQCRQSHHCIQITDEFMQSVLDGDTPTSEDDRDLFKEIIKTRLETGEPFLHFIDNTNNKRPQAYINNDLFVTGTNICTEIMQFTDYQHTLICGLASLNLSRFDEFKDHVFSNGMTVPEVGVYLLDAVISEFIDKSEGKYGLEKARRSAIKGRSVGIGVLGWHSFLQSKMIPFSSLSATNYTHKIFKYIKKETDKASASLAKRFGEPEWCKGTGYRNVHRRAVAPTFSNSIISGKVSPCIEPWASVLFPINTAKGTFIFKNSHFESLLDKKKENTSAVWASILEHKGSVMHLDFLSDKEKEVFKTFQEIDQKDIIQQASHRDGYLDQGQSLNLSLTSNPSAKYMRDLVFLSWRLGLSTLYYLRSESPIKVGSTFADAEKPKEYISALDSDMECTSCEG